MKRYWLFAGCTLPKGGFNDFVGDFEDEKDALNHYSKMGFFVAWGHIVDTQTTLKRNIMCKGSKFILE